VSSSLYLRTCTAARVGSWEDAPVRSHVSVDRQARERERASDSILRICSGRKYSHSYN
jgi:hypothetical protein